MRNWDLLLEGRVLYQPETGTTDYGALAAIYRHFGENLKVGVAYNFGRFSTTLRRDPRTIRPVLQRHRQVLTNSRFGAMSSRIAECSDSARRPRHG
ncbi:MAG: hypothetical protein H6891_09190 [Brucellaceae bacterium]|nr:hypothetical protein [Brucellaceae bacterium]